MSMYVLQVLVDFDYMWLHVVYARNVWDGRDSFSEVRYSSKLVQYCSTAIVQSALYLTNTVLSYSVCFVLYCEYLQ